MLQESIRFCICGKSNNGSESRTTVATVGWFNGWMSKEEKEETPMSQITSQHELTIKDPHHQTDFSRSTGEQMCLIENLALLIDSLALLIDSLALLINSLALLTKSLALLNKSLALLSENFELITETFALITELFVIFKSRKTKTIIKCVI